MRLLNVVNEHFKYCTYRSYNILHGTTELMILPLKKIQ